MLSRRLHHADNNLVQVTGDYASILLFVSYNRFGRKIGEVVSTIPSKQINQSSDRMICKLTKFCSNRFQRRDGSGTLTHIGNLLPQLTRNAYQYKNIKFQVWDLGGQSSIR